MSKNVILFMADQMRGDCLGCSGNAVISTPNLDMLASEGTNFTKAYTPSPSCIPARACLLTGMDQWHTGILGMGSGMPKMADNYAHTLPGEFAAAGYHTQGVGKMHFHLMRALNGFHNTVLDESARTEPGFVSDYVEWYGKQTGDADGFQDTGLDWNGWTARPYHASETLHPTHWTADRAIEFIKKRDPAKPFFLKCSFSRPHSPYDAPQPFFDMYNGRDDLPPPFIGDWSAVNDVPKNARNISAWRGKQRPEDIRRARAGYYGNVTFIDYSIGRILSFLKRSGLYNDCVIAFTSDHGDMLGDHHLWRKTYAYEGSARVPLIIKPANETMPTGQTCEKLVSLIDIMPTLLDMSGLPVPGTCDGVSMAPLLRAESVSWRDTYLGEHCRCYSPEQENIFVTNARYKLIWFPNTGECQLFDLDNDPGELENIADSPEHANARARLEDILIKELERREWPVVQNGELKHKTPDIILKSPNVGVYGVRARRS